ncbi:MAG: hypothetical protein JNJ48_08250, partial [Phycisphaerae bacterium]|nr:hypothetical protein [Phycisphaerae bacterium]
MGRTGRTGICGAAALAAALCSAWPVAATCAGVTVAEQPAGPAKGPAAPPTPSLEAGHPKYEAALKVYQRIARAWGSGRPAPRLVVRPATDAGPARIALFRPDTQTVEIDEAVIDLCGTFGARADDALAVLLGHELAHHYRDHGWVGEFGVKFADLEASRGMKAAEGYERLVKNETEADYFGAFYAYVAGYDTLTVAPGVFDAVYEKFSLADKLGGYPSRQERKKIAEGRAAEIRGLQDLFDAGRLLLLLDEHGAAAAVFDRLCREVPSRELLNNAAAARLLEVAASIGKLPVEAGSPPPAWALGMPVTFEMEARLGGGAGAPLRGGKGPEGDEVLARLVREAAELLERACAMDEGYAPARINLAIALCLRGDDWDMAVAQAKRAVKAAESTGDAALLGAARAVHGVAVYGAAMGADGAERAAGLGAARGLLSRAAETCDAARQSLALLDGKGRPPGAPPADPPSSREKICGMDFRAVDDVLEKHDRRLEAPMGGGKVEVMVRAGAGCRATVVRWHDRTGERTVLSVWAGPGSEARTAGGVG